MNVQDQTTTEFVEVEYYLFKKSGHPDEQLIIYQE